MIHPGDIVVLSASRHAFKRPALVLAALPPLNNKLLSEFVVQWCFVVDCGSSEIASKIRWAHVVTTAIRASEDEVQIIHEYAC